MSYQRHQRVESLIQSELNKVILKELEFPADLVTITSVEVQKDLDNANVDISVLPSEKSEEVLKILVKNRKHLRHLLLKAINIKPMPEISFRIDYGIREAAKVERVFLEIEKKEGKD